MANPLILKIAVDDKGNPAIINLGRNAQKAQKVVAPLGSVMKAVFASAVVMKGIALLNQGIRTAIGNTLEYELTLKRLGAIGGLAGEQLAGLNDLSRELATETEHSAISIAKAGLEIKKMGFSAEETMQALPTVVDLATASMSDLTEAAKNAMTTMRAFGLEAKDMDRVANVMATTVVSTGIDFEDFTESMKFVAPIAKTVGMSLEETAAMMGVLGNTAIKGSLGGTTLKNMFLNILKPSDNVRALLGKMNFEGKTFSTVLGELKDSGANVNDFLETFNKRAVAGALHLAGVSDEVNNLQAELEAQNKTVKEIADEIRDTTAITLKQLMNNLNEVVLSIWDAFGDRPKDLVQGFTNVIKDLDKWIDDNQDTIRSWGENISNVAKLWGGYLLGSIKGVIANLNILGPLILGVFAAQRIASIYATAAAIQKLAVTTGTLNAVMMTLGGPVGIAIMAIAGLALVLGQAAKNTKDLQDKLNGLADDAMKTQETELKVLMNLYDQLAENMIDLRGKEVLKDSTVVSDLLVEIETLEKKLGEAGHAFHGDILTKWSQAKDILEGMGDAGKEIVTGIENIKRTSFDFKNIVDKDAGAGAGAGDSDRDNAMINFVARLTELSKAEGEAINKTKEMNAEWRKFFDQLEKAKQDDTETYIKEQVALFQWAQEARKENMLSIVDSTFDMAQSTFDIISNFNQMALNDTLKRLAIEEKEIDKRHDLEIVRAGDSAFAKIMAEEKYQHAKTQLDQKRETKEKEAREKEKRLAILKATADAFQAIIGTLAQSQGGPLARAASAAAIGAIAFGYVATLSAAYANYRHGSAGLIEGVGNGTSDSNMALVSRGERVLSTDEVKQMGGNERIQQMIDRGSSVTNNRTVNLKVDTLIGTKEFISDSLIPALNKELSR